MTSPETRKSGRATAGGGSPPSRREDGGGSRRRRTATGPRPAGRHWRLLALLACLAPLAAVGPRAPADATRAQAGEPDPDRSRRPVVLVPGISGSKLRDRHTREIVWGIGSLLVSPKDNGYAIALPVTAPPDAEPRLEAFEIVEEMTLAGILRKPIYRPILEMLEARGYRRGDLEEPDPRADLFPFPYDWRLSNVISARRLADRLDRLRRARGEDVLEIDLICQSNGAHVCRYFLKYGGAPLDRAEAGRASPPATVAVRKLILMGSSNGGSVRNLREIDRGRSYIALIGRKWQPETIFTLPSMYQDLPVYRRALFLDAEGRELDVDLFDAESWRAHGWSIFSRSARRRLAKNPRPDLFADEARQLEFLQRVLDDSRRFHRLLARDVEGFGATRYYLLQSAASETPERAVLIEEQGGWRMLFTGDRELARRARLHARATSPGDGHATVDSQMWLSPQERAAVVGEPAYVDSDHLDLVFAESSLGHLADFLSRDAGAGEPADGPAPASSH